MASDQPASHGQPPKVAANLDVKLNTSPTSKPASQTSAFYHPFGQHNHSAMGDTYQTTFGANPLSIPNLTTSNTLDVHRHHSRLIALPASGSPDLKMDAAATYSPFNTFFASDLSAPTSPSGHAHSSLKQPSLASNSLKRKAGPSIASQMTQTPKQAKMDETMAGTELPGATPHSLQPVQASTLTPDEQPISGSPSNTVVSVKRNVGGRPKSAHAKPKKPTGPTRLRKNKPVEAAIHMDIWGLILPYCPLGFLFTAMKIDTRFQQSLKYESLWKDCRIQNYGADMPDPLPGMKEWDYAKLIEGLGCMGCDNKKTRKTYWAFQKRWCTKCLEKSTILVRCVIIHSRGIVLMLMGIRRAHQVI